MNRNCFGTAESSTRFTSKSLLIYFISAVFYRPLRHEYDILYLVCFPVFEIRDTFTYFILCSYTKTLFDDLNAILLQHEIMVTSSINAPTNMY